ncbi:MAG TPA: bifunctional hydroxymethylpyrimidine kinase/phosphomethylpyrimidine kinase [Xanthomonadales bacterium]|nr:bifunctional hydroxymethylpyrimidine kinase/phosphomethylpyrimidine kinase [Xanthomonadales bacterium]
MTRTTAANVLTIAGSDSGGGAGIQADLKTFAAHRVHGLSAIAALTAQNTRAVTAVHLPPSDFLQCQIDTLFDDFDIAAIKIGMLASAELIATVASAVQQRPTLPVVLDPVMVATSGARLLDPSALAALRGLIAHATVLTPNIHEAELLLDRPIRTAEQADAALHDLATLGARAVLLKGGHLPGDPVTDRLLGPDGQRQFQHPRLNRNAHGSGCTLAAAIAANLALGDDLTHACQQASDYLHGALAAAYRPGHSEIDLLDHFWRESGVVGTGIRTSSGRGW